MGDIIGIIAILILLVILSSRILSFVLLLKINNRQQKNEKNLDRIIHRMLQIEKTLTISNASKKKVKKEVEQEDIKLEKSKVNMPQLAKLAKITQTVKTGPLPLNNMSKVKVQENTIQSKEMPINNTATIEVTERLEIKGISEIKEKIEAQEKATGSAEIKKTRKITETDEIVENQIDSKAGRVLRKILNWIVVGDEFRNPNVSIEYAVASVWFIRIAVMMLILTVSFFLKYSIEHGFLSNQARMILSILAGVSLTFGGMKLAGKKYHIIGMGLIGGGIATLYGSIFAGFAMFKLINVLPAFAIMIVITIAAGWISVRLNSMFIAILSLIGGYATPVLVNSEHSNYIGLFSYMILLGICTLWIAKYKDWKLLNMLGVIFNYTVVFIALNGKYNELYFYHVFPFICIFFLLYSFIPIRYNIINKIHSTVVELIFMVLNTAAFYILATLLLKDKFDTNYLAVISVSLVVFYITQIYIALRRKLNDPPFIVSLYGMAAFFITYTVPQVFSSDSVTAAWAIQALVFIWVSSKLRSKFIRILSYIIYVLTFYRIILIDLSHYFINVQNICYWSEMISRFMTFGIVVISLAGAYFILKKEKSTDVKPFHIFAILSIGLLFLYSTLELNTFLYFKASTFRLGGVSILWSLFAIAFIIAGILKDFKYLRYTGLGLFIVVVAKVFFIDMEHLSQLYRIIALFALSIIMLGGGITYVKYKKFFEVTNQLEEACN